MRPVQRYHLGKSLVSRKLVLDCCCGGHGSSRRELAARPAQGNIPGGNGGGSMAVKSFFCTGVDLLGMKDGWWSELQLLLSLVEGNHERHVRNIIQDPCALLKARTRSKRTGKRLAPGTKSNVSGRTVQDTNERTLHTHNRGANTAPNPYAPPTPLFVVATVTVHKKSMPSTPPDTPNTLTAGHPFLHSDHSPSFYPAACPSRFLHQPHQKSHWMWRWGCSSGNIRKG